MNDFQVGANYLWNTIVGRCESFGGNGQNLFIVTPAVNGQKHKVFFQKSGESQYGPVVKCIVIDTIVTPR